MDGFAQAQKGKMMSDLISRQTAIDALHMHLMYRMGTDSNKKRLDDWINNLPSAEPKRGKWIKTARWGRVYYCNQCRNYLDFDGVNAGRGSTNFCPNCGAKMEVEHNG